MALFVDKVKIRCKAGDGGNGCVSFHREKYVQAGGPDGGDGGRGGDIIFVASERMHTLMDFRYKRNYVAANGEDGSANRCKGKNGDPLIIEAPVGTVVRDQNSGRILLDLYTPNEKRVLQKGGQGGFGNMHFATPTRQAPSFAKPGKRVEPLDLELELKSIADVGLIGFPNVGKSTILSVVTSARPKIANYHFTTLTPNLGIVSQDGDSFVLADIPGLVEGAAEGIGLGHDFLRHVERTRMLVHVLDISGSEARDPLADFDIITGELSQYGNLQTRPVIVAANKMDLPSSSENLNRLKEKLRDTGIDIFPVSAATGQGFDQLLRAIRRMLSQLPPPEPFEEELPFEEVSDERVTVTVENGVFILRIH